jgi:MerR family transcriptional regulator/heat shock protein HspR
VSTRRPDTRALFAIGVAAELAGMHPQTLRMYERRGLVAPRRTAGGTRLYSEADIALLGRIQDLSEQGLNLAGIERVMDLERRLGQAVRRVARLEAALEEERGRREREVDEALRSVRREIVHVRRVGASLVPHVPPVIPIGLRPPGA